MLHNEMLYVFILLLVICFVISVVLFLLIKNKKGAKGVAGKDYYTDAIMQKDNLGNMLRKIFLGKTLDEKALADIEETLVSSDIGPAISNELVSKLRKKGIYRIEEAIAFLKDELANLVKSNTFTLKDGVVNIVLVLGVNGVGKTTSIGKIANYYLKQNKKVLLAAGDTFRAAATEQLTRWAKQLEIPIIKQGEGADPASIVFDAIDSAKSRGVDLLIIDTAGRLHNKKHLMDELKKIYRIIESKGGCDRHNLLVIDSTTGQNAFHQAEAFHEAVGIDMIMMTKYDAMSKGGVVFTISKKLDIPFSFIGKGEKISDIEVFNKEQFIERIFN